MSGQYSSAVAPEGSPSPRACVNATSRPSAWDSTCGRSGCSLVKTVPSGSVNRTGGSAAPCFGGSTYAARKSKKLPHLRGFFAPATLPLVASTTANWRSPTRPRSVTSAAFSSSPIIDFTGYRQSETTEPRTCAEDDGDASVSITAPSQLEASIATTERLVAATPCQATDPARL